MGGNGPAPKNSAERRRRNVTSPVQLITTDGQIRGLELPESHVWPVQTMAWWETWRRSPMAAKFTDTDWSFLLDTAVLHAQFWLGDMSVASELRLRSAKFGATPEDRARLKIEVGDAPVAARAKPARGRRERLLKAVGDDGDG